MTKNVSNAHALSKGNKVQQYSLNFIYKVISFLKSIKFLREDMMY